MGKSSPQAPAAPDPSVVSAAQTQSNIATANANASLNRTNQVTPWGNLTYSHGDTANPDGTYNWTATTQLSPAQQQLLDSSNGISQSMANLGQQQITNVANTATKPLDFSGLQQVHQGQLQTSAGDRPSLMSNIDAANLPQIQNQMASAGGIQRGVGDSGNIQGGIDMSGVGSFKNQAGYGNIQDRLDTNGIPSLVGGDALGGAMKDAQNAAYSQQQSRLDPQWQQQQHDLQNQLTQQGVMQNSDAWNRAMGDFSRQKNDAYQSAYNNSVNNGNAAQAQLFGQGLSANQNAYGQALGGGQFANAAQQQGFGQSMDNANLNNSVVNSQFAQAQAQMAAANAAQQQRYGQNANNMTLANSAQQQQFGQNAADMASRNAAQSQGFGQAMDKAGLFNSAAQSHFNNGLMNAQLNNQAMGQDYAQTMGARNQGINELMTQQQNPLNVLNALRTGAQVTSPTFTQTPQTNMAGTDVSGIMQNGYNNQMGLYNSQVGQNNAITSGLFQLGSAAIGSDRNIKENIELVATRHDGLGIYEFDYKPEFKSTWGTGRYVGVMADEVEKIYPAAVVQHAAGYKMVKYGML